MPGAPFIFSLEIWSKRKKTRERDCIHLPGKECWLPRRTGLPSARHFCDIRDASAVAFTKVYDNESFFLPLSLFSVCGGRVVRCSHAQSRVREETVISFLFVSFNLLQSRCINKCKWRNAWLSFTARLSRYGRRSSDRQRTPATIRQPDDEELVAGSLE